MQRIVARASKASKFPLIRIFVILVTSAFLAGSISTGSEIIRKSHIKELAADVVYYKSVFTAFKTRYQELPGDMINASSYWSKCRSNSAECNGDGDGKISSAKNDRTTEAALAWQHLSLSGILSDSYSGNLISGYYIPGENIPKADYENSGYLITHKIAYHFASSGGSHFLKVGKTSGWKFESPVVSLTDAAEIDSKLDDGIASRGRILAYSKPEDGCLGNYSREILVDKEIAHYATNLSPDALCSVYFRLD